MFSATCVGYTLVGLLIGVGEDDLSNMSNQTKCIPKRERGDAFACRVIWSLPHTWAIPLTAASSCRDLSWEIVIYDGSCL